MEIRKKSTLTGEVHVREIEVTQKQLDGWQSGEPIQNVMPHLQRHEREFLISGITKEEWEQHFGTGEEEE